MITSAKNFGQVVGP